MKRCAGAREPEATILSDHAQRESLHDHQNDDQSRHQQNEHQEDEPTKLDEAMQAAVGAYSFEYEIAMFCLVMTRREVYSTGVMLLDRHVATPTGIVQACRTSPKSVQSEG